MKLKIPALLALITSISIAGLTVGNVLDTFVVPHESGKVQVPGDYDWDDEPEESILSVSSSSDSSSKETISSPQNSSASDVSEEPPISSSQESVSSASEEFSSFEQTTYSQTKATYTNGTQTINNRQVTYHLVEIQLKKLSDFRSLLATDSSGNIGTNITQSFSNLISSAKSASGKSVLCAISGDFPFWKGREGYVVRDGVTYRSTVRKTDGEDLAIYKDGTITSYFEDDLSFEAMSSQHKGIWQNLSFGPSLLKNGVINVTEQQEIDGETMSNNQRTALGFMGSNHLFFLSTEVTGSRNSSRAGSFSLYLLAEFLQKLGCKEAYNLDGGASVGLYCNGLQVVKPERAIGDILYVVNS